MPASPRRQKIEAMLVAEPDDQFLRYTLAIELEKEGDHARSLEYFRGLMCDSTPHVPAFFMAAQYLSRRGELDQARAILRDGIEVARRQGNSHAAGEMSEFLTGLGTFDVV